LTVSPYQALEPDIGAGSQQTVQTADLLQCLTARRKFIFLFEPGNSVASIEFQT
jgi:hypothetical protein